MLFAASGQNSGLELQVLDKNNKAIADPKTSAQGSDVTVKCSYPSVVANKDGAFIRIKTKLTSKDSWFVQVRIYNFENSV